MIVLEGLTKHYGQTLAVDSLSLEVEQGECVFLVGGSGSGKTTTLKMVNRLVEPSAGRVLLSGRDTRHAPPHELRRRIGYAFQQIGLFPHLDVAGNIGLTPELLGTPAAKVARRVDELLELVELDPAAYRARRPSQLSGGEQQRVGLARALAAEPEMLLLDEPFGALDPLTRDRLQQAFIEIRRALGLTVIFVSHDMNEALLLADRILVMQSGRVLQVGSPEQLLSAPEGGEVADMLAVPRRQYEALVRLQEGTA